MLMLLKKSKLIIVAFLLCFVKGYSQTPIEKCKLPQSHYESIYSVTVDDVKCLAKNSEQPNTLLGVGANLVFIISRRFF